MVEASGVAAHIGTPYYLAGTGIPPVRIDQNNDDYHAALVCAGAYLVIVAPNHSLFDY